MDFQPGDIIIRKEGGTKTVWVNQRILLSMSNVAETYLRQYARFMYLQSLPPSHRNFSILPDNGNSWRWARISGVFYYDASRIPNRAPKYYRDCLPPEHELIQIADQIQARTRAEATAKIKEQIQEIVSEIYTGDDVWHYRYSSEPVFCDKKAHQLAEARAWCSFMKLYLEGGRFKRLGIKRREHFFQICAEMISVRDLEGLKINTVKSLRNKIANYPALSDDAQRRYLISGHYGNANARKIGVFKMVDTVTGEILPFDIHQALIYNMYMNPGQPQKLDLITLWDEYKEDLATFTTEPPVSYRTFCQYNTNIASNINMSKARHGEDYYKKKILSYVPSSHVQYAHSLFAGDGSASIAYKWYDKEGKCRRMNLFVLLVSDVSSRYIAGWAPAKEGFHTETPEMVEMAVKMAVNEGGRQSMFEFVTDNHGAFSSKESEGMLLSVFTRIRRIKPNNSQANPAETQFRLYKKSLKSFNNFLRTSISAGINNQANPDFIPNNEMLPTYEEVIRQIQDSIDSYNNKPMRDGTTPAQRFANKHPDCEPMDERQLRHIFGYRTKVTIGRMRGMVDVWKEGVLHRFEIPEYENTIETIAANTGYAPDATLKVYWDATGADLYTMEGKYIVSCKPAVLASQAYIESDEKTQYAIGHHEKRKLRQIEKAEQFEKDVVRANELLYSEMVESYNLAKTDSNYSKEKYNDAREEILGNAPRIINDYENNDDSLDSNVDFNADKAFDDL